MDTEDNAKRWRRTHDEETGKRTMEKVGRASADRRRRKLNRIGGLEQMKKRITGVTTRPTDIAAGGKSETTGHASRDMVSSVQNDGPYLSSEVNKIATTHWEQTDNNTLHRMTARVRRPLEAIFSSLDQEQKIARTTRMHRRSLRSDDG